MGVYLSVPAQADLANIFEQIRQQSPRNADQFLDRVQAAIDRIERAPTALRLRDDELPLQGLRFAPAKPAVLIYKMIENGDAEVVRIAHSRQDFPALFGDVQSDDLG